MRRTQAIDSYIAEELGDGKVKNNTKKAKSQIKSEDATSKAKSQK